LSFSSSHTTIDISCVALQAGDQALFSNAWPRAIEQMRDETVPLRRLRPSEAAFLNAIFNNLDTSEIEIGMLEMTQVSLDTQAVTIGNTIMFNSKYDIDESIDSWELEFQSTVVHEAVHVWDGQNVSANTWINAAQAQDEALEKTGESINAYRYGAQTIAEFRRANPEARASQLEDAWRRSVGLPASPDYHADFKFLNRSAIPVEILRKEIDDGN
jgi:hypothetical protein